MWIQAAEIIMGRKFKEVRLDLDSGDLVCGDFRGVKCRVADKSHENLAIIALNGYLSDAATLDATEFLETRAQDLTLLRNKMKVKKQEIKEFVFAQPDDRKVDMGQNYPRESCGCVLVHYGKHQEWKFDSCGFNTWCRNGRTVFDLEVDSVFQVFP